MFLTFLLAFVFTQVAGWGFAQERPRLRISTLFIGSSLLPFWIAKDQGYFARAGVDVELIWMQSNLSTSALLAGEVDAIFGTPQVPLQVMSTKGTPNFIAIAAWASSSEHWLVVNPAIKSIKDLDGKIVATSRPKSADHGYALTILERNGIDTRRVTFLSAGGQAGRVAAVESGRVMGSVVNRYYALLLRRKGFKSIERLERADYPFPPSVFVAARENLQAKRSALRNFFKGLIEATKRLKTDKELSLKLIRKNLRLDNQEIIETAYDDGLTVSYPYFTERQFQVAVDLLSKSLGQPVDLSYARVVDHSIVDEIARNGGL
ncbi:MAG TPA: ABC transporter substrate-binding protein [Terriglobales bacterium]|nr:ABC transporter substrate-binding protein [Terriglobales bacterium]